MRSQCAIEVKFAAFTYNFRTFNLIQATGKRPVNDCQMTFKPIRLRDGYSPWLSPKRLPNDRRLKQSVLKIYILTSCGDAFRGRKRTPGTVYLIDWSLVITPRKIDKPWSQTNHGWHTKHTAICMSAPDEGVYRKTRMYSRIRRAHEQSNQLSDPNGLLDTKIVLLACGFLE